MQYSALLLTGMVDGLIRRQHLVSSLAVLKTSKLVRLSQVLSASGMLT